MHTGNFGDAFRDLIPTGRVLQWLTQREIGLVRDYLVRQASNVDATPVWYRAREIHRLRQVFFGSDMPSFQEWHSIGMNLVKSIGAELPPQASAATAQAYLNNLLADLAPTIKPAAISGTQLARYLALREFDLVVRLSLDANLKLFNRADVKFMHGNLYAAVTELWGAHEELLPGPHPESSRSEWLDQAKRLTQRPDWEERRRKSVERSFELPSDLNGHIPGRPAGHITTTYREAVGLQY